MTIEKRIKELEQDISKRILRISSDKLFGNEEVVKLLRELNAKVELFEQSDECKKCGGEGGQAHRCNCDQCEIMKIDCEACDGEGRILKSNL